MGLNLLASVYDMLGEVEEKTKKKIEYVEKNELDVSARIRTAREGSPSHLLIYKKDHDELINYVIANQCGHILRLYEADGAKRFFPVANKKTMMCFVMEAEDDLHRLSSVFGKDKLKTLLPLWYQGVVFQVTKMPPDIQIDKWIYNEFKDLRAIQLKCLKRQLINAVQGLSEDLKKITPTKIYTVSNVMNYAFFKILEDHLGVEFVAPYYQTVFLFDGSTLARMTEREYVNSHAGDVEMINKWADQLNLTNWFEWKHFDDMPGDYLS